MTADELDTAALRVDYADGFDVYARDMLLCLDEIDRLRAAGGVQPAPAAVPHWCEEEIRAAYDHGSIAGTCDDVDNVISALRYLFDPDFHNFDGRSTDGAGTPEPAEFIYPGGGLAFTELRPAGGAGGTTPTGDVCACEHPAAVDGRDCMDCGHRLDISAGSGGSTPGTHACPYGCECPEHNPARDPHCGIVHPHSKTSRCAGD